jgi:methyl-accepting chemotaxis protein
MLANGNIDFTIIAGMLITAFSILYYIKELRGQNKIKEETLRNSAYIKDIKDSADKAATLVKDTADKVETKLRDTADKVDVKLKDTADKALSVTNDSIETLQKKMDDFQLKFDALNKEIEKLKALVNEKEESVIETEKKIQEIKESQKKLAIYVDELLRQMIDML